MTQARDSSRSRRVLRLIALERIARSLFLLAAGTYLVSHLGSDFGRIADHLTRALELDPRRPFLHPGIGRLHPPHAPALLITRVAAIGSAAAQLVAGGGPWLY